MDYHSYLQMFWNSKNGDWLQYNGLKHDVRMMFQYHFAIILIPLSFIYFIVPHQLTLYFISTLIIASSVIPLYLIGKHFLKSSIASYLITLVFIFYPPFLNADLEGFAEEILVIPFGLFAIYFILKKRDFLFLTFCFLILTLRINMTAVVFSLGILYVINKFLDTRKTAVPSLEVNSRSIGFKLWSLLKKYKVGLIAMVFSIYWLLFIIIYISHKFPTPADEGVIAGSYIWRFFSAYGSTPQEIIITLLTKPHIAIEQIFIPHKITYIKDLFTPLLYLPIISPYTLFGLPIFMQNMLSSNLRLSAVYNYYQSGMVPFIFIGLIHSVNLLSQFIIRFKKARYYSLPTWEIVISISLLLFLVFQYDRVSLPARRLPFNQYYNIEFMSKSQRDVEYAKITSKIPTAFTVGMDEKFMEHLAERKFYYDSGKFSKFQPEIIITDSYTYPNISKEIESSVEYNKLFNDRYLNFFVRKDIITEYRLEDKISLNDNDEYIFYLNSDTKIKKTNIENNLVEFNTTSLYYARDFAQPFLAESNVLNKISFLGSNVNNPKGSLSFSIREDAEGQPSENFLYKTDIPFRSISQEKDAIIIEPNFKDLVVGNKYWVVLSMTRKNDDHDRFDITRLKSDKTFDLNMVKLDEDGSWQKDWSEKKYILEINFYYDDKLIDFKDDFVQGKVVRLTDGSIYTSGSGKEVLELLDRIDDYQNALKNKLYIVKAKNKNYDQ
jgi:uncharacterized membrane protein